MNNDGFKVEFPRSIGDATAFFPNFLNPLQILTQSKIKLKKNTCQV